MNNGEIIDLCSSDSSILLIETIYTYVSKRNISYDLYIEDLESLKVHEEDETKSYLTQGLIDFYLNFLIDNLPFCNLYYIANSFLYTKLEEHIDDFNEYIFLPKYINIIHYNYFIIPIVKNSHWSMVIIEGLNIYSENNKISLEDLIDKIKIYYFDSVIQEKTIVNYRINFHLIFKLIIKEYNKNNIIKKDLNNTKLYDKFNVIILNLKKQKNRYDCGIFLIYYFENFLLNHKNFEENIDDLNKWFVVEDKRKMLYEIIIELININSFYLGENLERDLKEKEYIKELNKKGIEEKYLRYEDENEAKENCIKDYIKGLIKIK